MRWKSQEKISLTVQAGTNVVWLQCIYLSCDAWSQTFGTS